MSDPSTTTIASSSRFSTGGGIKDTIESILVAFILAFVFRAFVVEAFVIPTGSMAPTLLGAHTRFHCPDCGYDFDVNFQPRRQPNDPEAEDPAIPAVSPDPMSNPIYCPNCGFQMPGTEFPPPAGTSPDDPLYKSLIHPPVFYGDRILVLKYLYMLQEPQRYDVVVFKAPIAMTTNYIKRLIGKPGEAVMVIDGDVYIRPPNAKDPNGFVVQPKPKAVQDALWRLVYDNDYHPEQKLERTTVRPWTQPWTVMNGSGWNLTDPATHGRALDFTGDNSSSRLQFSPQANPTAQSESDYLIYDQQSDHQVPVRSLDSRFPSVLLSSYYDSDEIPVSDLDLRATYQRTSGDGPLHLSLTKRNHKFTAEITPTQAVLYQEFEGVKKVIGQAVPINAAHPIRIELSNADYQVTLRVNGDIAAQSTAADFAPNLPELVREYDDRRSPPPGSAEIEAANQHCQITHLSLWRDVYYYNHGHGVVRGTPDEFPSNAVVLKPDEYFVMGDNSILSYDARCWGTGVHLPGEGLDVDAGRVPARFMLGKAFYVYWPAGYLAYPGLPAFVPNFGSMRFIH